MMARPKVLGQPIFLPACLFLLNFAVLVPQGTAQIVPDATLPNNSIVIPQNGTIQIEGGSRAGSNLFHSFEEFSVPTNREAFFNNLLDIQNILTRVTGRNISQIDGLIRTNGSANLFLINPNGIIFGPNARLNIGGSFIGSTANRIVFADGIEFNTANVSAPSLLSINVPIGLQFNSLPTSAGAIQVQGTGHALTTLDSVFSPFIGAGGSVTGLRVAPGKTIALVGRDIVLDGGILTAPTGRIELGSVDAGLVSLAPLNEEWTLGYAGVTNFRDIQAINRALLDASGMSGGAIALQGRTISLRDGSAIAIQNQGFQPAGNLSINASEALEAIGTTPDGRIRSSLVSETVGFGSSGDVTVSAKRLSFQGGAGIFNASFGGANGGNIIVNAAESVELSGFSSTVNPSFSTIGAATFVSGNAGNVTVSTRHLTVQNGGNIGSVTFGTGTAGDVNIQATESVEVAFAPAVVSASTLSSITFNTGDAGSVTINTSRMLIRDGGRITAATFAAGSAGSVIINATESIEVSGTVPGSRNPSFIDSSANILDPALAQLFRLPPEPTGDSKDVTINTPVLRVMEGGLVSVRNEGPGNAGTLRVNTGSIFLDSQGGITATTVSGEGGNINLQTQNLRLQTNSLITATAGGTGNGGNLTIDAEVISALKNSNITANAVQGRGGNIQISTQALFRSSDSNITASSQFGVSGVVQVNAPDVEPSQGLIELPETIVDATQLVASTCRPRGSEQSEFIVTGRGGLPPNPNEALSDETTWVDLRPIVVQSAVSRRSPETTDNGQTIHPIVEAQGWVINAKGEVALVTQTPTVTPQNPSLRQQQCTF